MELPNYQSYPSYLVTLDQKWPYIEPYLVSRTLVLQDSRKWERGDFLDLVIFLNVFPYVLNIIPQTWHSQLDICNYSWKKPHLSQCIARCVDNILRKNYFFMYNCIDSVASVIFVEISSRHQETHAKKAPNLVSPLSVTSQNCWGPGFWIPT